MTLRRTVLITGGSSGIGSATAELLLARGDSVAITGRSLERLDNCAERLGRPEALLTLPGDAADPGTVRTWVDTTITHFGRLDAAVASAGYATSGGLADGDPMMWPGMVQTNVLGPALLIHYTAAALRSSGGRIVLIGSVAGLTPTAGNLYGATKYAVTGLAENARRMLIDDEVGVTLISPGRVQTKFWTGVGGAPDLPNLAASDVAEVIVLALESPKGVELSSVTIRPPQSPV